MNAIVGLSELIAARTEDKETLGYISSLQAASQNLLMIINSVMDYNAMEQGNFALHREITSLSELIADVIDMTKINILNRDALFLCNINPRIPDIQNIDKHRIKQVLLFLLNNAVHTADGGYVSLNVDFEDESKRKIQVIIKDVNSEYELLSTLLSHVGSKISCSSQDNGGKEVRFDITNNPVDNGPLEREPESIDGLFAICMKNPVERDLVIKSFDQANTKYFLIENTEELFSQNQKVDYLLVDFEEAIAIKDREEFSALNTQIVCLIDLFRDKKNAGDVKVLRRPFFFPNLVKLLKSENGNKKEQVFFEGARVLVVDDNAVNLLVTENLLQPYKIKVETVSSGEEAIELLHEQYYDLVLMDQMMPGLLGTETTAIIRSEENEYLQNIPIIALSANVLDSSRNLYFLSGMNDFVPKPINIKRLEDALRKWIPESKQQKVFREEETPGVYVDFDRYNFEHFDTEKGLSFAGNSIDLYLMILKDFANYGSHKKADLLKYVEDGDIKQFTIEIHSAKSLSYTIGADKLGDMALELEKHGREENIEAIREKTGAFIEEFEALEDEIRVLCEEKPSRQKKIPLIKSVASLELRRLIIAIDGYDYSTAEDIIGKLNLIELPERMSKCFEKLKESADNIEYEEMTHWAEEMLACL